VGEDCPQLPQARALTAPRTGSSQGERGQIFFTLRTRGSNPGIVGWIVGLKSRPSAAKLFRMMVARDGVEPPTPAFSVISF